MVLNQGLINPHRHWIQKPHNREQITQTLLNIKTTQKQLNTKNHTLMKLLGIQLTREWIVHSGGNDDLSEEKVSSSVCWTEVSFSFGSVYWGCKQKLVWRVLIALWLEGRWKTLKRLRTEHWKGLKAFYHW